MSFLLVLDKRVLALCTRFAHSFQRLTGKTSYFIAKVGIFIASIDVVLNIANYYHPIQEHEQSLLLTTICMIYLPIILWRALQLDKADDHAATSAERVGIPGVTGASVIFLRLFFLYWVITDTMTVLMSIGGPKFTALEVIWALSFSYGLTIFYYFVEVTPLRPHKSTLRKLVESTLSAGSQPETAEANQ